MNKKKYLLTNILVTDEQDQKLRKTAFKKKQSKASVIREAIDIYLELQRK